MKPTTAFSVAFRLMVSSSFVIKAMVINGLVTTLTSFVLVAIRLMLSS